MVAPLFPLVLTGAAAARRGKRLVGPVDLQLDGTGVCVVIGPNGAGKTTLLRLMHGAARLSEGQISWACGVKAAQQQQAFVFQRPIMLRRTVEENLIYPLRLRGVSKAEARASAASWADRIGLQAVRTRAATVLSGGEQQKLAIARALITQPAVLFLDEPTSSLDGTSTREVEDILISARRAGTALILSTHDMGQARRVADHVVFLHGGRVHEEAPAADFFDTPQTAVARAFLNGDIVE